MKRINNELVIIGDEVLTKIDGAEKLLSEAKTIPEIKHVLDLTEAVLAYAKCAKSGLETINYLAQLKILAERKLGLMLKGMPKNVGSRNVPAVDGDDRPTLGQLGLSKDVSSRAQKLASIDVDKVEKFFEEQVLAGKKINLTALVGRIEPKPEIKNLTPDFESDAVARLKELWSTLSNRDRRAFISSLEENQLYQIDACVITKEQVIEGAAVGKMSNFIWHRFREYYEKQSWGHSGFLRMPIIEKGTPITTESVQWIEEVRRVLSSVPEDIITAVGAGGVRIDKTFNPYLSKKASAGEEA